MLLLLVGILLPAHAVPADDTTWRDDILIQVNAARAIQALPALQWNTQLADAAAAHAADLQSCGRLAHEGCNGSQLPLRISATGYAYRRISENLALCPCDAAAVVQAWLGSDGHRQNLLDPAVTEMGADTRADVADIRRNQWVLVMGRR